VSTGADHFAEGPAWPAPTGPGVAPGVAPGADPDVPTDAAPTEVPPTEVTPPSEEAPSGAASGPAAAGAARPRRRARRTSVGLVGAVALLGSSVLQVVALFPHQAHGFIALSSQGSSIGQQVVLAVGTALAAVAVMGSGRRAGIAGAWLAAGIALAGLGVVISSLGEILPVARAGTGLVLVVAAWAVGAVGALLALVGQPAGSLGRPRGSARSGGGGPITVMTVIVALVLAVALLPAWDSYRLTSSITGRSITVTMGSAFASSNPGWVTFGDVVAAIGFFVPPALAALWRPARIGIFLSGGVLVVVVGQLVAGLAGIYETTAATIGASSSTAAAEGLVIRSSLTAWYDVEVVAALALVVLLVARWWTPAGGSLLDTYPSAVRVTPGAAPGPPGPWSRPGGAFPAPGSDRWSPVSTAASPIPPAPTSPALWGVTGSGAPVRDARAAAPSDGGGTAVPAGTTRPAPPWAVAGADPDRAFGPGPSPTGAPWGSTARPVPPPPVDAWWQRPAPPAEPGAAVGGPDDAPWERPRTD
jgi:hypothetical protein